MFNHHNSDLKISDLGIDKWKVMNNVKYDDEFAIEEGFQWMIDSII